MRLIFALLAGGLALQAQSWEALSGLKPGDKIKVAGTTREETQGKFQAVSERGISVDSGSGAVEIERGRVRQVQVRASSRRVRNILIGVGIGLVIGIVVDQTAGTYFRNEQGGNAGARAGIYAVPIAVFGGIGALLPTYRTIYRSK